MATERFRIEGMEHAIRQIRRAPVVARKHIGDAVRVTEILLAQRVRQAAPRDTGALAQSIGSETRGLNARITIEEGELYGRRPDIYWRFVEFGTVHRTATPFIRPAAEGEQEPFLGRMRNIGRLMEAELNE